MAQSRKWLVGVDWASTKHDVSLADGSGSVRARAVFQHSGEGLAAMAAWIVKQSGAPPEDIHVAIEMPHGPVVECLLERGMHLYSINPKQVDRFRDRYFPSGAKDDRRDSDILATAQATDPKAFRRIDPSDPAIVELREWSRMAEEHTRDLGRLMSRLRDQLNRYYPQVLALGGEDTAEWRLALLELAPTPAHAARLRRGRIERFLRHHRVRCHDADELMAILRAPALQVSQATVNAASAHVLSLLRSIRLAIAQLKEAKSEIDRRLTTLAQPEEDTPGQTLQRDVAILRSLPGSGRMVLATLLTEAPQAVRERDYHGLRRYAGAAPVTRQSGKKRLVLRRWGANKRLQNALRHWAHTAVQIDPASKAKYQALRAKGHSYARCLRSIADRLLYVAMTMLERGCLYDPNHPRHAPKQA
jgi:transposase